MVYIIFCILLIIIGILLFKLSQKEKEASLLEENKIAFLHTTTNKLQEIIDNQNKIIEENKDKIIQLKEQYQKELNKKTDDLNQYFENQKQLRQADLDLAFEQQEKTRQENLNLKVHELNKKVQAELFNKQTEVAKEIKYLEQAQRDIVTETQYQQERFEAILESLKKYEMEQQDRLFYTIIVPDEYKEDINFLITTVSQKVQHPDIINKLVWAEYVRPYIEQTFKRVGIEDKAGIYKITNIDNGKSYIGKSTNIKKRLTDHFKSSIGIKTIADQAVHHEIWKNGFWNWMIEPVIYCDKEQLNDLEKYYIDFFKTNTFGYNKTGGGEG